MKLIRVLFVLSIVGAAIAMVQRMMEEQPRSGGDFWKPTDPLSPHPEPDA